MKPRVFINLMIILLLVISCSKDEGADDEPVLRVNKITIDFGDAEKDQILTQTFIISNRGDGTFSWTSSVDQTWVSLNTTHGTVGSSSTEVTVTVDTAPLESGSHTCTITIESGTGSLQGSPVDIVVSVNITAAFISGHELAEDETWSGNVTLTGDIVIPNGFTLTIEPGTIIKIVASDPDYDEGIEDGMVDIYSSGNIVAAGTEDNIIIFTSDEETPALGDWWGIGITDNASLELEYCCIAYAEIGLFIFTNTSTSAIANTMFAYSNGIVDFGPNADFSYNTFINGEDGYARWEENYTANISYCVFDNNSWRDIVAIDSYNSISVDHSNFIDNGWYNLYISDFSSPVDVVITADNCFGITAVEDNGVGTINITNPAPSPVASAGCGFDLSSLQLKSAYSNNNTLNLKGFRNREELIRYYYQKGLLYQW